MNTNFNPETANNFSVSKNYLSRKRNDFNDLRLEKTYTYYLENVIRSGSTSILQSTETESEATRIYRFLNNEKVTLPELIFKSCRIKSEVQLNRHLLVLGDSAILNMSSKIKRITDSEKMGTVQGGKASGFYVHPSMVMCPQTSTILGLSDLLLWNQIKPKTKKNFKKMRLEDKSSYKWHLGVGNSKQVLKDAAKLTYVFDREADSFELLYHIQEEIKECFVIRQSQNRLLKNNGEKIRTLQLLEQQGKKLGEYQIEIDAKTRSHWRYKKNPKLREQRTAQMEVNVLNDVELLPTQSSEKGLSSIKINLLEVKEINDLASDKEPVLWRLWTNHSVNNLEEALVIVGYYLERWNIEELFRTVKKKGFNQEATLLETTQSIMKQTVITFTAACKIMQLVKARGNDESQPIEEVFEKDEVRVLEKLNKKLNGKTEKQKNHNPPTKLSWASWVIARLGGWKGYESKRPPGPITMKRGYDKFCIYMEVYNDISKIT